MTGIKAITTDSPTSGSNMMLFGIGNVGGRAVFYALQRGSLPGLRLFAADDDAEALSLLKGVNTAVLPPPSTVAVPAAMDAAPSTDEVLETTFEPGLSAAGKTALHELLAAQASTLQLLTIVCGLGGETGGLYGLEAIRYAKEHGLACAAVVIMPHPFESEERKQAAAIRLRELEELAQAHIVLPCAEMFPLFGEETDTEAFSQGVRWLAECSLGFLRPFVARSGRRRPKQAFAETADGSQLTFVFDDHPTGIFVGVPPTNIDGQNLDIPTWRRRNIEFETEVEDTGRER